MEVSNKHLSEIKPGKVSNDADSKCVMFRNPRKKRDTMNKSYKIWKYERKHNLQ